MEFMSRVSRVKQFSFVCISLNNGPIFNPIKILELSQSPLYSQCISFYYMSRVSRVSRVRQKLTLQSMEFMSRVSRVKQFSFVCISLNNGPIFNPIKILELSQSPLYSQCISFYYMSRVSRVRQKLTLQSMEFMSRVSRVVIFTSIYNVYSNSKSLNYNIL